MLELREPPSVTQERIIIPRDVRSLSDKLFGRNKDNPNLVFDEFIPGRRTINPVYVKGFEFEEHVKYDSLEIGEYVLNGIFALRTVDGWTECSIDDFKIVQR